ncbi:uncharacterized protein LOC116412883 [Galleria mellonella]|uniref:Uncharacterized protein LOC116412883 n=1 Tax=Galleria mellonella TaxID=7137 RepID=A0A6J3C0W2_GALME|nr:uncharacterized protein LOC116412883 [Galleria mellonella]
MKKKYCMCVLLLILFFKAFGEEKKDESTQEDEYSAVPEAYSQVFKDLPALYEYIIATLQDKPEVLENSNAAAFDDLNRKENHNVNKRNANYINVGTNYDVNSNKIDDLNNIDYGVVFIGADSSSRYLDPDEIAAKAIWVEQELEDYNS